MTSKIIKGEVMSASNGGTTRRRISLLAGSSLVAATVMLSVCGVALTPTKAWAINECAPIGTAPSANGSAADTFTCTGAYASGITYSSAGPLTVNYTGAMNVGTTGVNLAGNTTDSVTFGATTTGAITGTAGPVIDVSSVSGAINLSTRGVTGTNANVTYGILAVSTGGGAVTIDNPTGNVNVTASTAGVAAIRAVSTGGNGAVSVNVGSVVTGRQYGIQAQASGTGALTITLGNAVNTNTTAGVANIDATTGAGLLTITTTDASGSLVFGGIGGNAGSAVRTNAGGDAVINNGIARGFSTNSLTAGALNVTAVGNTTVNNAGTISAGATGTGVAVRAAGGSFTLVNDGSLVGSLDMSAVTGAVDIHITDHTGDRTASWSVAGTSIFGSGESVVTNEGQMTVLTATLTNLGVFENSGDILFGQTPTEQIRTGVGQVLSAPGVDYVGSSLGSGRLFMEAKLDTAGQASCAAATVADCFSLVGGSTSGVTTILVSADGPVTTSPSAAPIVLVDVNGGESHAGDFILDRETPNYIGDSVYGAVIGTNGLLGFALQYDEDTQRHYLGTVVPSNRLEYVATLGEVLSVWHTTSDVVAGRQADLRDRAGGGRGWIRVAGEQTNRDSAIAFTASGATFEHADEYELQTTTAIGGIDLMTGDNYVLGVHAGGVKSTLERESSPVSDQIDGVTAGLYGAWWSDTGLTLDGTLNGNFLKIDQDRPIEEVSSTNVTAIGARAEAGWRMGAAQGFYVQPLLSLAYVRADLEEVRQNGYGASWEDVSSLRAGIGVRVGGDTASGPGRLGYWATGRLWNELGGEGALVLSTLTEDIAIEDEVGGAFQELGAGLTLSASETLEGFASAGAKFGDGFDSYSASFGLRLRW